jgi:hypothetical protein
VIFWQNKIGTKAAHKMLIQDSNSSMLDTHIFLLIFWHQNLQSQLLSFVIFGAKILYKIFACKMLMKLIAGFFYSRKDFEEQTFSLDDIFDNQTVKELTNSSLFSVKTIHSIFYGKCYSISKLEKIAAFDFYVFFKFKTSFDVNLYVHTQGN